MNGVWNFVFILHANIPVKSTRAGFQHLMTLSSEAYSEPPQTHKMKLLPKQSTAEGSWLFLQKTPS